LFKAGSRRRVGANDPRQASRRPKYDHTHTQNTATSCRVAPVQPVGFESIGKDVWVLAQDQGWGLTCAAVCTSPGGVLSPQTPNARLPGRGIPPGAHKAAVPGPLVTGYVVRGETYPVTKAQAALYFKRTKRENKASLATPRKPRLADGFWSGIVTF